MKPTIALLISVLLLGTAVSAQVDVYPSDSILGSGSVAYFGVSVDVADVNLDGYDDLLIGEPGYDRIYVTGDNQSVGRVQLYSGADHSLLAEHIGETGTSSAGNWLEELGDDVCFLKDYTGDGIPEYGLWGAKWTIYQTNNDFWDGRFVIYNGATHTAIYEWDGRQGESEPTLMNTFAALRTDQQDGVGGYVDHGYPNLILLSDSVRSCVACGGPGGDLDVFSDQTGATAYYGYLGPFPSMLFAEAAGDVNRDGYYDYMVGRENSGTAHDGQVFVYSGADNSLIHRIDSNPDSTTQVGRYAGPVGDINKDGYDDIAVVFRTGYMHHLKVFSGYYLTNSSSVTDSVICKYDFPGERLRVQVEPMGDVNGDDTTDFIVGLQYLYKAVVIRGGEYNGGPATVLANLVPSSHVPTNGGFARSIDGGHDIDHDGYIDVVIGASQAAYGAAGQGAVYIYGVQKAIAAGVANTQPGTNVEVVDGDYDITYDEVTDPGNTTVSEVDCAPPPPDGYKLIPASLHTCFDINSDAIYIDGVTICYDYSAYLADIAQPKNMKMLHYDGHWTDVTTSNDLTNHILCGRTDHFSEFSIVEVCCAMRGDADGSDDVNVADLTFLVAYLFNSGPVPTCFDDADVDASGDINVADLTALVDYLFNQGAPPASCPQ